MLGSTGSYDENNQWLSLSGSGNILARGDMANNKRGSLDIHTLI